MSDIYMRILLEARDTASKVVKDLGGLLSGKGGLGSVLLDVGVAATGLAIGLGVESVKAAGDFQTAMLSNVAHAGLAKSQFDAVSQSVLAMAPAVGRGPTQLAEALYPILSAFSGIQNQSAKSALSLDTLRMSFQTVAGTTVDGTAVANAAVGTFNALGLSTDNVATNTKRMTGLFDIMDKTVQLGNMQWDQYKMVISKLAVSIQGTSVKFNEASSALATMTNEGYTARQAQTYLSNLFTTMVIKTDALAKHAAKLGGSYSYTTSSTKQLYDATHHLDGKLITIAGHLQTLYKTHSVGVGIGFDKTKFAAMDLAEKIKYLTDITHGNKQELLALLGNNATALRAFNALSKGIDGYKSNLDALNHSQGALAASFDVASQGFQFQMSQMEAAGQVLLVTIGTQLLPILSDMLKQVLPLIQGFTDWITKSGALNQAVGWLHTGIAKVKEILPYIWQFLTRVGTDIHDNVLPPMESLITNVKDAATKFLDWLDSSGAAKTAMDDLGIAVDDTSVVLGTLIGWVSTLVGWLSGGGVGTDTLYAALSAVAAIFITMKIVEFANNVKTLAGNVKDVTGKFLDFASNLKQTVTEAIQSTTNKGLASMQQSLQDTAMKADAAGTSVKAIGIDAETSASQVAGASTAMETDLTLVGTDAAAAGNDVATIGTKADAAKLSVQGLLGALALGAAAGSWLGGIQQQWSNDPTWKKMEQQKWHQQYPNLPYPKALQYSSGIENFAGGMAYVHQGEVLVNMAPGTSVVPANRVTFGGGGASGNIHITNHIYAQPMMEQQLEDFANEMANRLADRMRTQFSMYPTLSHS